MDTIRKSDYIGPVAVGLLLAGTARLVYLGLLPKPLPNVPHNPVAGIMGDIPEMTSFMEGGKKNIVDYFASMIAKHGPICQVMVSRTNIVIVAENSEYERLLLKTKSLEQSRWTNAVFGSVIPTSQISLPTNEMWRRHRQLTGPSMSRRYLERMSVRISAAANNLVRLWTKKVELVGDKVFDAHNDMRVAIMDTILSITIGNSPSFVDVVYASLPASSASLASDKVLAQFPQSSLPPLQQSLRAMMEILESIQFSPFPIGVSRLLTWMLPSRRRSYHTISDFLGKKIAEARVRETELQSAKQGEGLATDADCIVDMIAQREAREGVETFSDGELLDELITYVLGGQDTTAATLSWVFKYLPQDNDIQCRLHDEVCTVFGSGLNEDGHLDFTALNDPQRVPVLEAVVVETLRCGMPGPNVGRERE
ncbi:hypothetical protein FRC07_000026 [Ceratobasidium sp. 392]|nr:hypothetical protein FRC07_000026 [Ceratobasidium sp. 392]